MSIKKARAVVSGVGWGGQREGQEITEMRGGRGVGEKKENVWLSRQDRKKKKKIFYICAKVRMRHGQQLRAATSHYQGRAKMFANILARIG